MNKKFTTEEVTRYAEISKDTSAIHLDAEVAAKAGYGRPIVHGMLIMGTAQSFYLAKHPLQWITNYSMQFHSPLEVDSEASFQFRKEVDQVHVTIALQTGELIAEGIMSVKDILT
ncbi:acyl dehydratase [Paenibacillus shirakamiensis]|uniref:Acyl dehydratase n=1 Tax=Paenibacillus shirakamiensis TaxID=1265935 RepID=A0ABS4JFK1_9BACL|nr:MaoC family dehydratase [Paenibacillus shirakamiensis]MBP1999906.1 acyl dehydratase [Paenibacillus shirakamiensis]